MTVNDTATSAATSSRATTFEQLVRDRASAAELASHLDALSPDERVEQVVAVKGRRLAKLWEIVDGATPITLEEMVPPSEQGTRIYEGRNSLPAFTRFQKRMTRLSSGQVIGYNHQVAAPVTGPGYFVVKAPEAAGDHPGELYFDYSEFDTAAPSEEPEGWPPFKPNEAGLSSLVYAHMKDYCRRVARGVLIGKAYKNEVSQNAWFTLTYRG
jgi:hypothetical protein